LVALTIAASADAVIFQCNFGDAGWITLPNVYTCFATIIYTETDALEDVKGTHLDGRSNSDVEFVFVQNENTNRLTRNMEKIFPNLVGLSWGRSNLTELSAEDFQPFPNILFFAAFTNKLVTLDGDLFRHTRRIRLINFANNRIETVGENLFNMLTDLERAAFEMNRCIDMNAVNIWEVEQLTRVLVQNCAQSESTTVETPEACLDLIHSSDIKISTLMSQLTAQNEAIIRQNEIITRLEKAVDSVNQKMKDLKSSLN
jgi:hypothetical protein